MEYWHGVDVSVAMRLIPGLMLQGGTSTGRTVTDDCELKAKVPEPRRIARHVRPHHHRQLTALEYCHSATNWLTQVKFLGSLQRFRASTCW